MAQHTSGGAYDFARFERAQAAPQRVPARPQKTPQRPVKVPEPRKNPAQRKRESIDSLRRTVKTILVSGLLLSLLGGMLYSEVRQDELTHAYRKLESQMAIAQSENTRLNMELSAKLSLDKVEAYAREKLGMVKNDAPVACINIPQDNEVLLANGKSRQAADSDKAENSADQKQRAGTQKQENAAASQQQPPGASGQKSEKQSSGSALKDFLEYLF